MPKRIAISLLLHLFLFSIASSQQSITLNYKDYKIEQQTKIDSGIYRMLSHYKETADSIMNKVIGFSTRGLYKRQPESELGNFMTDCMKEMGEQKFNRKIDAAFVNLGGVRSYIPKGDITIGKIYELMPFDNLVVLQEVKGSILLQFLSKVAEKGGWPISGITMQIKDKMPTNILVGGKPLNEKVTYTIANSDYIASGGAECEMLKSILQINIGYNYRDALIAYVEQITKQGKPIDWKVEGRITY